MSVKQGEQVMSINDKNIVLNAKAGSFIDIHKAFDSVWHNGLFYKLLQLGMYVCMYVPIFIERPIHLYVL